MFIMFVWFYLSVAVFAYLLLLIKLVLAVCSDMVVGYQHLEENYFVKAIGIALFLLIVALLWPFLLLKVVFEN
jgi:hypothetical protein